MRKKTLPQMPKILAEELREALDRAIREFGAEAVDEILIRRKKASPLHRFILDYGIGGKLSMDSISMLERTLEKFRKYKKGGASDYISSPVESHLAKIRSRERNKKRDDFGEHFYLIERNNNIVEWAKKANYESSSDKASVVSLIANRLAAEGKITSESQIRRVLSNAGLTRKKKTRPQN